MKSVFAQEFGQKKIESVSKIDHWKYQWFPWCISIVCVIFEGFNVTLTQPFCHSILLSKLQIHWVTSANFFFFTHILNRLDVRIHLEASKIYHTYTKNWVNRDWVIRFLAFFGHFWAWEANLHCKIGDFNFLSVSSDFFTWNHIASHRYWWHWVFRTILNTLRALLKSSVCATQLCIRSDTASYWCHHNIMSSGPASYFQNIDSSLLNCYIRQNDIRKVISSKKEKAKKMC